MADTIFATPFFTEMILPFLLVFTLIFAILEKTKILGEEKRQINAIISFVIGLILLTFPFARDIIVNLMPVLAVAAVILLVFMILYGFASGDKELKMPKGLKVTFAILIGISMIVAILVVTGYWDILFDFVGGEQGSQVATNAIFIVIIIAAIAIVLSQSKKSGGIGGE